jgi:hypothetical protein
LGNLILKYGQSRDLSQGWIFQAGHTFHVLSKTSGVPDLRDASPLSFVREYHLLINKFSENVHWQLGIQITFANRWVCVRP